MVYVNPSDNHQTPAATVHTQPAPFLPHPVLPLTYGLHTTLPVPASRLITPFTSTITPSSFYLADPLNAYAHLGMTKPYVHLVGPRSMLHSKRGSQGMKGDLCGMGIGRTLFCDRCCAQVLVGRRTSRRRRRRRPRRIPVEKVKNVTSDPRRTTRASRFRSASSPCMTSERARGSCSPGSGIKEHRAQFTCAAQTPGMFP